MFLQDRGIAEISNLALKKSSSFSRVNFTSLNVEKLKGVLCYFSYLHKNGEISDKAFESLVRYACSIFIENEVEEIVQDALERKLMQFLGKHPEAPTRVATLLKRQKGKCTHCGLFFHNGDLMEIDHRIPVQKAVRISESIRPLARGLFHQNP